MDFNLIYYHRETGEKFRVKRIDKHTYIIELENERVRISVYLLNKTYRADRANSKVGTHKRITFYTRKKVKEIASGELENDR